MKKALAALALSLPLLTGCGWSNPTDITIKVNDKARVCASNGGSCQYLIYTDQETFKDVDSLVHQKFNSSDIYGRLKSGHTYLVHVEGFRSGFLSHYRNIVSVKAEVSAP